MNARASTGVLLWLREGSQRPRALPDRLSMLALVAAAYLILALSVPGAFLLADDAADTLHEARESIGQLVAPAGASPERFAESKNEHHEPHPASESKRLRGVLESTGGAGKMLGVLISYEAPVLWTENAGSRHEPVFIEAQPEELTPPPQLLQRPPPGK